MIDMSRHLKRFNCTEALRVNNKNFCLIINGIEFVTLKLRFFNYTHLIDMMSSFKYYYFLIELVYKKD